MPKNEIAFLKQILDKSAYSEPGMPFNNFKIKEKSPGTKLTEVEIQHIGQHSLIILPEQGQGRNKKYSPLLSDSPGYHHNKACDAVILCTNAGRHYQLLCELKSSNPRGAPEQFRATKCFLEYVNIILQQLHSFTPPNRSIRRIVFNTRKTTCQTLDKKPVSPNRRTSPEYEIHFICVDDRKPIGIGRLINP